MKHTYQAHEGQVLVLFAIGTIILMAFAALAVDVGLALSERRGAQNAADAATLAVARAMVEGETDDAVLRQTALHYAQVNGYDIADLDADIQLNGDGVEVIVRHDVTRAFLGAFYDGDWAISADAQASLDTVPADYGLIALDETGNAINATGNTHLRVDEGGIMSNADINCGGSSTIRAGTAVHAAGSILDTSQLSIACVIAGENGGESSGRTPIEDPLAGTPAPPGPPAFPTSGPAGSCAPENNPWDSATICQPGRYTSWPSSAAGGWGLRLMPGTYILENMTLSTNIWGPNPEVQMVPGGTYNFFVTNSTIRIAGGTRRWDMSSTSTVNMYFRNSHLDLTGGLDQVTLGDGEYYFQNSQFNVRGGLDLLTLGSGLYYFDNSDFEVGAGASAVGQDVSFFFRNGGRFETSGNSSQVEFTAPSTPLYGEQSNMLFHVEPGSNTTLKIGAFSRMFLGGLVYAPDSHLEVSGNVDGTWARGQLIVRRFTAAGSLGTAANPSLIEYLQLIDMGTPQVWLTR